MKNIILVAKREFLTQVKKKSFLVLTILTPFLIIAFGGVVGMIFQANKSENDIRVIDRGAYFEPFLKSDGQVAYTFTQETEQSLKNQLYQEKIDGILIIPKKEKIEQGAELLTNKNIGIELRLKISQDLTDAIRHHKVEQLGLSQTQIQDLDKSVELQVKDITKDESDDDMVMAIKMGLSGVLMYIIFIFIFMYGVRIMRGVLEEKTNRVVEILVSSVKPLDLMLGKIFGVMGVALVQFSVWIAMIIASHQLLGSSSNMVMSEVGNVLQALESIDYGLILFVFVVYFLLGYLLYSGIYAGIAAAVDSETDTQQFSTILMIPMFIGMYGSLTIMNNPDGPMSFWLSMVPFTSPFAMLARIPFGVPAWELALSMFVLALSALLIIYLSAKIYRIGILMYGNKVSYKELWKWLKS